MPWRLGARYWSCCRKPIWLTHSIFGDGGAFGVAIAVTNRHDHRPATSGRLTYQPYLPNGIKRTAATIMRNGVLEDALADLFSWPVRARIDAARAQSYGSVPVPRMTNIRIELP